jgi:hypothetical protein
MSSSSTDGGIVPNEQHLKVKVNNTTISDPESRTPKLTNSLHVSIVKQGTTKPNPIYEYEYKHSKDVFNHRFTVADIKHRLKNGEEVNFPRLA